MATSPANSDSSAPPDDKPGDVWTSHQQAFSSKRNSQYYDPCQEAANKSIKCMHRNAGDKDMCQDYFQAYRDCKKEWTEMRRTGKATWMEGNKGKNINIQ